VNELMNQQSKKVSCLLFYDQKYALLT